MKKSGQKSKLCVTLVACIITIYGKIFCIFSRPTLAAIRKGPALLYNREVIISDFGADDPGSIPDVGAGKENVFSCCFPVLRRAF